jgi:hypothetical protein
MQFLAASRPSDNEARRRLRSPSGLAKLFHILAEEKSRQGLVKEKKPDRLQGCVFRSREQAYADEADGPADYGGSRRE